MTTTDGSILKGHLQREEVGLSRPELSGGIGMEKQLYLSEELKSPELSSEESAYIAGLFDGEGTITIMRQTQPARGYQLLVTMGVAKADSTLNELKQVFGGILHRPNRTPSGRPTSVTRWQVTSDKAYRFLQAVFPYLRIKAEEARVGIEFHEMYRDLTQGRGRKQGIPEIALRKGEEYKRRIHECRPPKGGRPPKSKPSHAWNNLSFFAQK